MNDEPEKPPSVTLERVRAFFFLLGTGIIMAVLILILEITVYRRKQNKRTEHSRKQNKRNVTTELVWKKHHPPVRPLSSDRQEK
jgi:heme/copper-type cytochrome/quinol oxidase subunit 2